MKGLFVINSLEGGGAERVFSKLVELINHDTNAKYNIEVILLDKFPEVYLLPENITVYRIGTRGGLLIQLVSYIYLIFKIKPDFVLSFLPRANLYNTLSGFIFQHKSVISERSNSHGRLSGKFKKIKKILMLWVFRQSNLIIAVSHGVASCLIEDFSVSKNKVAVLNNPYNLDKIKELAVKVSGGDALENPYIVSMGRLVKTKGFDDLISAFSMLESEQHLIILGQGPELENLQSLASVKGVGQKVHFYGFKHNPYPIIAGAELYVLPSYLEGFPNALVEAMALSKPVLSTNCTDGPSDILVYRGEISKGAFVEAEYGLMISTGDIAGLLKGLNALLESPEKKLEYSAKSLKRAKDFTEDKFYEKYSQIISDKLLGEFNV